MKRINKTYEGYPIDDSTNKYIILVIDLNYNFRTINFVIEDIIKLDYDFIYYGLVIFL